MVGLKKETVYVTYTCKKCGKAFIDVDPLDNINELPLKNRYCPECVKNGYKNSKLITPEQLREKEIKQKIKELGYTDPKDVNFLKKYIKQQIARKEQLGQRIYLNYILKDAIEVLGYQD